MIDTDRHPYVRTGSLHKKAILTEEQVLEIEPTVLACHKDNKQLNMVFVKQQSKPLLHV